MRRLLLHTVMPESQIDSTLDTAISALLEKTADDLRLTAGELRENKTEAVRLVQHAIFIPECSGLLLACGIVNTATRPDQVLKIWVEDLRMECTSHRNIFR